MRDIRTLKLSRKLIIAILIIVTIGLPLSAVVGNRLVRLRVYDSLKYALYYQRVAQAQQIDAWFETSINIVDTMYKTAPYLQEEQIISVAARFDNESPFIESIWLATADGEFYDSGRWMPPEDFVLLERPWWQTAEAAGGETVITLPYIHATEEGVHISAVSRFVPDFNGQPAVIAMNIYMDALASILADFQMGVEGDLLLLGPRGEIIIHPETGYMLEYNIFNQENWDGEPSYFFHFPLESIGWSMMAIVPTSVISEPIFRITRMVVATLAGGLFVVSVAIFIFTNMKIIKPIDNIRRNLRNVAVGKFNAHIVQTNTYRDEVDWLAHDLGGLVDVIESLSQDISNADHQVNMLGDIEYRVDASKYQNSFNKMAKGVNNIIDHQVNDVSEILQIVNQLADGDFTSQIRDMPGKKNFIPETVRKVLANLQSLYDSASHLAANAADGNFEEKIDPSKFKGSWCELAQTLNDLVDAVAEPLAAIEYSLSEMQEGNFEASIDKTFKGSFENIKLAVNKAERTTLAYIREISAILQSIAEGDLSVEITRKYRGSYAPIKAALTTILESLNATLSDIQAAVEQVATGAAQITTSSTYLAEGVTRQTASIEELSSSMELIYEKATQASNEASTANQNTVRSRQFAAQGGAIVNSMTDTMGKIKDSSESISKIIDVITNIAFQTNLLALNASVEAARAGEHGKGFSVVADEVRILAGRSQQSASETSQIIGEDVKNVEEGMDAANEVSTSFETISRNIGETSKLISHIASISAEQLDSISSVNASVSEISGVVTESSAAAEESAAASQELSSQAGLLKEKVAFFTLK